MQEESNVLRASLAAATGSPFRVDWSPFLFGCAAGVVPWAIILAALLNITPDLSGIPAFVWALLAVYFAFFNCFPVNMLLQMNGVGWWSNEGVGWNRGYFHGERVYQVLSLVAKSLLLWLVIGGTNQPNAFTQEGA